MDSVYDGRQAYWFSQDDQAVPPEVQRQMLLDSKVPWIIGAFPSDHSPFLSRPGQLTSWLIGFMRSWQGLPETNLTDTNSGLAFELTANDVSTILNSSAPNDYNVAYSTATS